MTGYVPVTPYMAEWCNGNILGSYPEASSSTLDSATRKRSGMTPAPVYLSNILRRGHSPYYYNIDILYVYKEIV